MCRLFVVSTVYRDEREISMKLKTTVWGLIIVCVCSFSILLSLGSDIYREAPPLPKQVITHKGESYSLMKISTKDNLPGAQWEGIN